MSGNDGINVTHHITATEIPWALKPTERLEDVRAEDLLALDPADLLWYAQDLREQVRALRETLQAAIETVARQHDQLARATRLVASQRAEIRALRQDAAA